MTIKEKFVVDCVGKVPPCAITGFTMEINVHLKTTEIELVFDHFGAPKINWLQRMLGYRLKDLGNGVLVDKKTFCVHSIRFTVPHDRCYTEIDSSLKQHAKMLSRNIYISVENGIDTSGVIMDHKDKIVETAMKYIRRYW